jgi:hypothetical protein
MPLLSLLTAFPVVVDKICRRLDPLWKTNCVQHMAPITRMSFSLRFYIHNKRSVVLWWWIQVIAMNRPDMPKRCHRRRHTDILEILNTTSTCAPIKLCSYVELESIISFSPSLFSFFFLTDFVSFFNLFCSVSFLVSAYLVFFVLFLFLSISLYEFFLCVPVNGLYVCPTPDSIPGNNVV